MKKHIKKILKILMIGVLFYPLFFLFTGSIMGNSELTEHLGSIFRTGTQQVNWTLFPEYPTLVSYIELLFDTPEFFVMFWNTVKYTLCIVVGQLCIALPAAWALANMKIPFKKFIVGIYFIVLLMPFQVRMLPEYLVLRDLNLINTSSGIILPEVFSTLPVLIMYYSFLKQPKEIIENAKIDGGTNWQIFLKISVPIAWPGIATCMVLALLEYWNMIEQPLIFIKDKQLWPLALFMPQNADYSLGVTFAMAFLIAVFVLIIFLTLQKYFEEEVSTSTKE